MYETKGKSRAILIFLEIPLNSTYYLCIANWELTGNAAICRHPGAYKKGTVAVGGLAPNADAGDEQTQGPSVRITPSHIDLGRWLETSRRSSLFCGLSPVPRTSEAERWL
jgi:hypothetical protein